MGARLTSQFQIMRIVNYAQALRRIRRRLCGQKPSHSQSVNSLSKDNPPNCRHRINASTITLMHHKTIKLIIKLESSKHHQSIVLK
jgi:hypothetical protein